MKTVSRALGAGWKRAQNSPTLCWSIVGLIPFLVYLRTLAPTVYGLDSAELTTGAWCLGIVHSPGSPTYLLLGHMFGWLPFGDVGYRLNLMSAVASALGALFVGRIVFRLTGSFWPSVLAAWLLTFSYYYWVWALAAELYSSHACWVAGLVVLTLRWEATQRRDLAFLVAFLFGLSMGNHMATVLLLPAFSGFILTHPSRPWRSPGWLLKMVVYGVLGFSVYLYLPLRHLASPPLDYVRDYCPQINLASWPGFTWMVTGQMFSSMYFQVPATSWSGELARFAHQMVSNFHGLGLVIGAAGLCLDFRIRKRLQCALVCMFVCHLVFYVSYGAGDKAWMFSITYVIWAIWFGLGLYHIAAMLRARSLPFAVLAPVAVGALLVFALFVTNRTYADLSHDTSPRDRGERVFAQVEPGALVVCAWDDAPVLEYLQIVEGRRRDIRVLNWWLFGAERSRALVLDELKAGRAVYTSNTGFLSNEPVTYNSVDHCHLVQVLSANRNRKKEGL